MDSLRLDLVVSALCLSDYLLSYRPVAGGCVSVWVGAIERRYRRVTFGLADTSYGSSLWPHMMSSVKGHSDVCMSHRRSIRVLSSGFRCEYCFLFVIKGYLGVTFGKAKGTLHEVSPTLMCLADTQNEDYISVRVCSCLGNLELIKDFRYDIMVSTCCFPDITVLQQRTIRILHDFGVMNRVL